MATPSGSRPGRSLAAALGILIVLYAVMFATGHTTPQLGLDLRGGTEVVLKPRLIEGSTGDIKKSDLNTAVDIIRKRVNGIGVAEADVRTEGNNIVVSVPGKGRNEVLKQIGTTAKLYFRHVLQQGTVAAAPLPSGSVTPGPTGSASPQPTAKASAKPGGKNTHDGKKSNGRAVSGALLAAPRAKSAPSATPTPAPTGQPTPSTSAAPAAVSLTTLEQAQAAFASYNCKADRFVDQADLYLVACDDAKTSKFILEPAKLSGSDLKSASATLPQQSLGGWQVDLSFKGGRATTEWGNETAAANKLPELPGCGPPQGCNSIAVVLDRVVESYPRIVEPIYGGNAQISGDFSQDEAEALANVLKYGALPIELERLSVSSVSSTLGDDQLKAGLLAGALGLILVIIYSLVYYRGLGLVTVASLAIAGAYTYAAVCLLGPTLGFTLTLAGIAGLIVSIGITADSFVVYFERLRDEVREGRSLRSAVERGWERALRTILAADFVSLLAAGVLYFLSIGSVRGFAFTLGLSTLIDLVVVIMFTKPLVTVMVRSKLFGSGAPWTGLSPDRLGARTKEATAPSATARPHRRPRTEGA